MNWEYGGAYLKHDMEGEIHLPNDSVVEVADWMIRLPDFMRKADTLFIDPPWNVGNLKTFYTKAAMPHPPVSFMGFTEKLFERIDAIAPETLFLEMGKEFLDVYLAACKNRYRRVTFYNSTYFHKPQNKCYVVHATNSSVKRYRELEDMDEEDIIRWICANHSYRCIGDLCMGRGLVGRGAYLNGKSFVGTELNQKRLAVLVEFIKGEEQRKCL